MGGLRLFLPRTGRTIPDAWREPVLKRLTASSPPAHVSAVCSPIQATDRADFPAGVERARPQLGGGPVTPPECLPGRTALIFPVAKTRNRRNTISPTALRFPPRRCWPMRNGERSVGDRAPRVHCLVASLPAGSDLPIAASNRMHDGRVQALPGEEVWLVGERRSSGSRILCDELAGGYLQRAGARLHAVARIREAEGTQHEYRRMLTKGAVAKTSGDREIDNRLSVISEMLTWGEGERACFQQSHCRPPSPAQCLSFDLIWLPEHTQAWPSRLSRCSAPLSSRLILASGKATDLLDLTWGEL